MGYSTRNNGQITDFWPDNTDTTLWFESGGETLQSLLDQAEAAWGPTPLADISISSAHIHTHCLYYDRYDPGDYTDFTCLTRPLPTPE